jgi:hypothetical protein
VVVRASDATQSPRRRAELAPASAEEQACRHTTPVPGPVAKTIRAVAVCSVSSAELSAASRPRAADTRAGAAKESNLPSTGLPRRCRSSRPADLARDAAWQAGTPRRGMEGERKLRSALSGVFASAFGDERVEQIPGPSSSPERVGVSPDSTARPRESNPDRTCASHDRATGPRRGGSTTPASPPRAPPS